VHGGAETVCYCPTCAESKFAYFSKQRAHRLAHLDGLDPDD